MRKTATGQAVCAFGLVVYVCAFGIPSASAALIDMTVVTGEGSGASTISWSPSQIVDNGDGSFDANGSRTQMGIWSYSWDMTAKADPFVNANLTLTNLSGSTQTFTLLATVNTSPAFSPAFYGGSVSATAADANRDGVLSLSGPSGGGIYGGLIDGTTVLNLLSFSSSITCSVTSPPTPPCTLNTGNQMDGLSGDLFTPDGSLSYSAGVSSSIALKLQFSLSGGDSVTFNSLFNVVPVPLPAAVWLLGSGIVGLWGMGATRRRRRSGS